MKTRDLSSLKDKDLQSALPALRRAARRAAVEARRAGIDLVVWEDGQVVFLSPDEFELRLNRPESR